MGLDYLLSRNNHIEDPWNGGKLGTARTNFGVRPIPRNIKGRWIYSWHRPMVFLHCSNLAVGRKRDSYSTSPWFHIHRAGSRSGDNRFHTLRIGNFSNLFVILIVWSLFIWNDCLSGTITKKEYFTPPRDLAKRPRYGTEGWKDPKDLQDDPRIRCAGLA